MNGMAMTATKVMTMTKAAAMAVFAAAVLAGCAALPSANPGAEEGVFSRPEQNSDLGGTELVLYPVAVWGAEGASVPVAAEVDGREVYVRKRRGRWLDRARVRMGLFWNTRGDDVYLLVAMSGPPGDIRTAEVRYDGGGRELSRAGNVRLLPGRSFWDGGDGKTPAVFAISPEVFADVLKSQKSGVVLDTSRGVLEVDLGALRRDSRRAMRRNAKVLFWQFYERMTQMREQN